MSESKPSLSQTINTDLLDKYLSFQCERAAKQERLTQLRISHPWNSWGQKTEIDLDLSGKKGISADVFCTSDERNVHVILKGQGGG